MAFRFYRKCLYFTLGPWNYLLPDFLLRHFLLPVHPVYFSKKWSFTGLFSLHSYCFKILFLCPPASSSLFTHGYSMRTQSHYDSFSRFYRLPPCGCHTFIPCLKLAWVTPAGASHAWDLEVIKILRSYASILWSGNILIMTEAATA